MKKTVTLEIAGARYRMTSDADEIHLRRLADLVNARVAALGPNAAQRATPAQMLAMAALDLADDLVAREDALDELRTKTAATVKEVIARIDQRLSEPAPPPTAARTSDAPGARTSDGLPAAPTPPPTRTSDRRAAPPRHSDRTSDGDPEGTEEDSTERGE